MRCQARRLIPAGSQPPRVRGLVVLVLVLVSMMLMLIALLGSVAACGRKYSDALQPKPWPERATKTWTEQLGEVRFEVKLPEGLGIFRDPRARIFRVDNLGLGPLVSLSRLEQMPANLQAAMEDAIVGDSESFGTGKPEPDGFWITVKNRKTGMLKVYRWLRRGNRALRCYADFFWRNETPRDVPAHNALLERICRSAALLN